MARQAPVAGHQRQRHPAAVLHAQRRLSRPELREADAQSHGQAGRGREAGAPPRPPPHRCQRATERGGGDRRHLQAARPQEHLDHRPLPGSHQPQGGRRDHAEAIVVDEA